MSELDNLLLKYCPDGVGWHPFFDVCDLIRGITYNKEQEVKAQSENAHKVLRANNITLHFNILNFEDVKLVSKDVVVKPVQHLCAGDILMCAGSGSKEHIGKVAFIPEDMDYTFGGFMAVIRCKRGILPRFVFHILTSSCFSKHLDVQINSSTINNINKQVMQAFELPVPPLPVQKEIVRILDTFTELHTELHTELQKRVQQYSFYRDNLLSFKGRKDVEWKKLGEIYSFKYGKGNTIPSGVGLYPVYGSNGVVGSFDEYNSEDAPVIGHIGAYAGIVNWAPGKHFVTYNGVICRLVNKSVLPRFGYYLLLTQNFIEKANKASQPFVSYNILEEPVVPVPSLDEQNRIVSILDRFDAITRDLSRGLPAEIEARKLQCDYYRDKLLTFKRKES